MKFGGKELLDLGCPQNKIKFFVGREFESVDALKIELLESNKPKEIKESRNEIFNWIFSFPYLPFMLNGNLPVAMSKGELRRVMENGSIQFNGRKPKPIEDFLEGDFPVREFIWFPNNSNKKTTWV